MIPITSSAVIKQGFALTDAFYSLHMCFITVYFTHLVSFTLAKGQSSLMCLCASNISTYAGALPGPDQSITNTKWVLFSLGFMRELIMQLF